VSERPIIMSAESVRAILAGRKTQTRRVVKPQPELLPGYWRGLHYASEEHFRKGATIEGPYQSGERLWVRESACYLLDGDGDRYDVCTYHADDDAPHPGDFDFSPRDHGPSGHTGWRPSIHMPRWASRLTLEITDVRVERLQAIGGEDVVAEGFTHWHGRSCGFALAWDGLNAHRGYSWYMNPWVWVIEFRPQEASE
jgi:hypothetical protein